MGELPLGYAICEIAVAILAVVGNFFVLVAFVLERRLRKVTNFYILSLAMSDFLVGLLGVPSALLTRLGLPKNSFKICVLMLSLLVLLCTVSILNLVAVTLDRYWAIIHPFCYKRMASGRSALLAIMACWVLGSLFGLMPLFGWNNGPEEQGRCLFIPVMHYNYLVLIFFATIVYPTLLMAFCYARIYAVVLKQLRQIRALEMQVPSSASRSERMLCGSASGSERSLQLLNHQQNNLTNGNGEPRVHPSLQKHASKKEVRTAKNLAIIVIFFMICWMPLYTANCVDAFCSSCKSPLWLLDTFIVLSHANSAINPFLYAYHLSDFRNAFKRMLMCFGCFLKKRLPGPVELESLSAPALSKMAAKMVTTRAKRNLEKS